MPSLYTTLGPWTLPTFTLVIGLAVIGGAALGLRRVANPGAWADAYLVAVFGGVIGARLFHVLLNWDYFADNLNEAFNLGLGGLDWHGAVIGAVIGLYMGVRARNYAGAKHILPLQSPLHFPDLLDSLTLALPLLALAGWWGCWAAACGYGAEVNNLSNYPGWAVAESGDVYGIAAPRYNTQVFGLILSFFILLFAVLLFWRGWLRYRRFWFTLALLSAGMFVIGFFRGDHTIMMAGLRADQWLDGLLVVISVIAVIAVSRQQLAVSDQLSAKTRETIDGNK